MSLKLLRLTSSLKIILLLLYTVVSLVSFGQTLSKNLHQGDLDLEMSASNKNLNKAFLAEGVDPEYPGGIVSLISFAKSHLHYPKSAINDNLQGLVIVKFVIDVQGLQKNLGIVKHVRNDIDSECLNMLKKMPRWKPGKLYGDRIDVNFVWKIRFKFLR